MADEEKRTLTEQGGDDEIKPTPEYTAGEAERFEERVEEDQAIETPLDEATVDVLEATEEAARRSPIIRVFDETVSAAQNLFNQADAEHSGLHHDPLSDTTTVFGREITVPGGLYTVVFGALAAATVVEFILFELPRGFLTVPLMLAFGIFKAVLVVMFYMHLRSDSRVFTVTLLIPLGVALVATLFLLAVPVTGY
jgi:caa(3)-type oxidase subunit IV